MPPAFGLVAAAVGGLFSSVATAIATGGLLATIGGVVAKTALAVGLMELTKPKKPKVADIATGTQIQFKADPNAGVPLVLGRTATGGNIVHVTTTGQADHNNGLGYVVVLSTGPMLLFEYFMANGERQNFGFNGNGELVSTGTWAGNMAVRIAYGSQPEAWHEIVGIGSSDTTWDQTKRLSGLGTAYWFLGYSQKAFPTGVPKPLWIIIGPKVYDPRYDSTYPGGNGNQRWYDESTWAWQNYHNPYIQALTWCIGWHQNGNLIHGAGISIAGIDVDAFVEGANFSDGNGWTCGGVVSSADRKWDVLKVILQAGGGEPIKMGGKISVLVNKPRAGLALITQAEIKGKVTVGTKGRRDRINKIVPRYRSEDHNWEFVSAQAESFDNLAQLDRGVRSREVEYTMVQNVRQAAQLARYDILNSREQEPITIPLGLKWADYKPGDAVYVDAPELGLSPVSPSAVKLLILKREIDLSQSLCILHCRTETDTKHSTALYDANAVPPPVNVLPRYDFSFVVPPSQYAYIAQGASIQGPFGTVTPVLRFSGGSENPLATNVIFRYRIVGFPDWGYIESRAGDFLTDKISVDVTAIAAGVTFECQVAYKDFRGLLSEFISLGTIVSGYLIPPPPPTSILVGTSATNVQGVTHSFGVEVVFSNPVDVYVLGGTPPYTYHWTQPFGAIMNINNQFGSTGIQMFSSVFPGQSVQTVWRITVTDAVAATGFIDIVCDLYNIIPTGYF